MLLHNLVSRCPAPTDADVLCQVSVSPKSPLRLALDSESDDEERRLPSPASINNRTNDFRAVCYVVMNIVCATAIVFCNKAVFQLFHFKFVVVLTLIHTIFTWVGMSQLARFGFFPPKQFKLTQLLPLAVGYVAYIILGNMSLNLNSVGFYQIMKVAVAPAVLVLEFVMNSKRQSLSTIAAVVIVCAGITVATVTDPITVSNTAGLLVGVASTAATALYQIWAGSKQKELDASSSQLLLAYTPLSLVLLAVLTPLCEPIGWQHHELGTLLGYHASLTAVAFIVASSILGVLVSLSTFLVIGATSSLSFNIVGHLKTVIILTGGCVLFNDSMDSKRLAGLVIAMAGIAWYTKNSLTTPKPSEAHEKPMSFMHSKGSWNPNVRAAIKSDA